MKGVRLSLLLFILPLVAAAAVVVAAVVAVGVGVAVAAFLKQPLWNVCRPTCPHNQQSWMPHAGCSGELVGLTPAYLLLQRSQNAQPNPQPYLQFGEVSPFKHVSSAVTCRCIWKLVETIILESSRQELSPDRNSHVYPAKCGIHSSCGEPFCLLVRVNHIPSWHAT